MQTEYNQPDDLEISFKIPKNVTNTESFIALLDPTDVGKYFEMSATSSSQTSYFRIENPNLMSISEDDDGNIQGVVPFKNPGTGDWSICIFGGQNCTIPMPCVNLGCVNITINDPTY